MEFVVGLPHDSRDNDAIWVLVDRIAKSVFILLNITNSTKEFTPLYMNKVLRLHGVPKSIVLIRNGSLCHYM
jgi:hypothetical protein